MRKPYKWGQTFICIPLAEFQLSVTSCTLSWIWLQPVNSDFLSMVVFSQRLCHECCCSGHAELTTVDGCMHVSVCVCEIVVFELGFLMTTGHILLNLSCIPPNLLADRMLFFTSETNKLVHYCYHLCPKFQLGRQHEPSNNCGRQVKPNDQSLASPVESRHECAEMIVWILPHSMAQHTTV